MLLQALTGGMENLDPPNPALVRVWRYEPDLRVSKEDVAKPPKPLSHDQLLFQVTNAVLCSEMGANFSPCGKMLVLCVACKVRPINNHYRWPHGLITNNKVFIISKHFVLANACLSITKHTFKHRVNACCIHIGAIGLNTQYKVLPLKPLLQKKGFLSPHISVLCHHCVTQHNLHLCQCQSTHVYNYLQPLSDLYISVWLLKRALHPYLCSLLFTKQSYLFVSTTDLELVKARVLVRRVLTV